MYLYRDRYRYRSFRYSNANQEAFQIAGEMVALGINAWSVAEKLYESQPQKRLELLALALATLTFLNEGISPPLPLPLTCMRKPEPTAELTDGFVNYPRSIRGVEVCDLFPGDQTRAFQDRLPFQGKSQCLRSGCRFWWRRAS